MKRLLLALLLATASCGPTATAADKPIGQASVYPESYVWYGPGTIATMKAQLASLPDSAIWMQFDSAGHRWNRFLVPPNFQPTASFPAFEESTYCPPFCITSPGNAR